MKVQTNQRFVSNNTGRVIKVLNFDETSTTVANIFGNNKIVPNTTRTIQTDSIRRRYSKLNMC